MKSTLTITVKEPCKEKFSNFSTTEKGGFCQSCEKEVIDFTKFSDKELVRYLGDISYVETIQEKHTVTGTIVDEANEPLPGVNVVLKGTAIGTQTDFDGNFEFPQQLVENDVLVFSFIGYETKTYKVKVNENANINLNI